MEAVDQMQDNSPPLDVLPFARSYQIEALEKARKQNTIVFLEAGSGKTLIAVMLLRSYSQFLRHPSPYKAVFLVPTIVLVTQQAEVVKSFTDFKVGTYSGEMKMNLWDANTWKEELDNHEVLVMTPQIFLNALRHSFVSLGRIKVLIFDECHNALKDHPYAKIMKEFYHPQSHKSEVPRILGMTASPVKAKGSSEATEYRAKIQKLEKLMDSKVYTCDNQSVLEGCISFPAVKFKFYEQNNPPFSKDLDTKLSELVMKHVGSVKKNSIRKSVHKRLQTLAGRYIHCVIELGLWVALKALEPYSSRETANLSNFNKHAVERFNLDVQELFKSYFLPGYSIHNDTISEANTKDGLVTNKVASLQASLLEYRDIRDLRCIVFAERVMTAIALQSYLSEQLKNTDWKTKYMAGKNKLQSQSKQAQSKIIKEFREGEVNIIVATSILEEGLDVQSCNLVIRFNPSSNICSFIQSRGRARMKNSDFILMLKRGDESELAQAQMHIASLEMMRSETLQSSSLPCEPSNLSFRDEMSYQVESTGAVVSLSNSVELIHFYCSKLPSDGYFKPVPHFIMDEESSKGILQLPNSCPVQSVDIKGATGAKWKAIACLEACKRLHQMGALTDHLVPDIVEEANVDEQNDGEELYNVDQAIYLPPELISNGGHLSESYHLYYLDLKANFVCSVPVHNVILAFSTKLDLGTRNTLGKIEINQECNMDVMMEYLGECSFTTEQVVLPRKFQAVVFRVLVGDSFEKLNKATDQASIISDSAHLDYLILPSINGPSSLPIVDWRCIRSVLFHRQNVAHIHENCSFSKDSSQIHTKNGLICRCMLKSSLVYTPHSGHLYLVFGFLNFLNINSDMCSMDEGGDVMTYKDYFKSRHGIDLQFDNEVLFGAKPIFRLQNFLLSCGQNKRKAIETSHELPPEVCYVIMSPISATTFHTFSLVALIMHRIESMLVASNLQKMYADQCTQSAVTIPTMKILEAITTKKCQEEFHLESLETLGDSFLKYAVSQQLFKRNQNHHEGLLSLKRERIISNDALCKLGCKRKIPGFIRNQMLDPRGWRVPGDRSVAHLFEDEWIDTDRRMYKVGTQRLKAKRVADVVEALIGAFLSSGSEVAALSFMNWLGIEVDSSYVCYNNQLQVDPAVYVRVDDLQDLLQYTFRDPSLLVEALTHGSYMDPGIPRCYQRLEFLGDAVLDHLVTLHLYSKHPGLSPGLLTEMRSASVNNDCYAYTTIRAKLHEHILHDSNDLRKDFDKTTRSCQQLLPESIFGWQFDIHFPKVLADVIESLAGAIFVDSGYDKDVVFKSLRPLLEPLVTPETLKIHPFQELQHFCQKHKFVIRKPVVCRDEDDATCYKLEVEANGVVYAETHVTTCKKLAQKITSKAILKTLKDSYGC